jgi:transposase-like protein
METRLRPVNLDPPLRCPSCASSERQIKAGKTARGSQRRRCRLCNTYYTPERKPIGYSDEVKLRAIKLYLDGMNFRRIGRTLGVNHQSVINWVNEHHAKLPPKQDVSTSQADTIEFDELFTFIGEKKTERTS